MSDRHLVTVLIIGLAMTASGAAVLAQQGNGEIRRTANGQPDLTGTYDTATLTPLQRPQRFGDNLFLSEEEAAAIAAQAPQAGPEGKGGGPADLGEVVTDKLIEAFPDLMDLGYPRSMEGKLDAVEEGGED